MEVFKALLGEFPYRKLIEIHGVPGVGKTHFLYKYVNLRCKVIRQVLREDTQGYVLIVDTEGSISKESFSFPITH